MNIYKFRKALNKETGNVGAPVICALCGHNHTGNTSTWRTIRLSNNKTLLPGYYRPWSLSEVEKYKLNSGEHDICSTRQLCLERQLRLD